MSSPFIEGLPSAKDVVKPVEALRGEINGLTQVINEVEGKLLELCVQRERLMVMRSCMEKGFRAMFGEHPVSGQLDLPLGHEN